MRRPSSGTLRDSKKMRGEEFVAGESGNPNGSLQDRVGSSDRFKASWSVPSMRRPVSVKPFLSFFLSFFISSFSKLFPLSQAAAVATLPSALLSSRCCYLIIDLFSPLRRELVQALSLSPDLGGRAL